MNDLYFFKDFFISQLCGRDETCPPIIWMGGTRCGWVEISLDGKKTKEQVFKNHR